MIVKKEISTLLKAKGKVRGNVLQTDAKFVTDNFGEKGLKKLEQELKKTGVEINYQEIKNIGWYPLGWRAISILVIKEVFGLDDKKLFHMGQSAPKNSFIIRTILKYFVSKHKTFSEVPRYWEKHYSEGKLIAKKIDLENNFLEIHIKDFDLHPYLCLYYQGYFKSISEMILNTDNVEVRETACSFKGGSDHTFILTWK